MLPTWYLCWWQLFELHSAAHTSSTLPHSSFDLRLCCMPHLMPACIFHFTAVLCCVSWSAFFYNSYCWSSCCWCYCCSSWCCCCMRGISADDCFCLCDCIKNWIPLTFVPCLLLLCWCWLLFFFNFYYSTLSWAIFIVCCCRRWLHLLQTLIGFVHRNVAVKMVSIRFIYDFVSVCRKTRGILDHFRAC